MKKKKLKRRIRNYVAKYMEQVSRPAVEEDKKKKHKKGDRKHKNDYSECEGPFRWL